MTLKVAALRASMLALAFLLMNACGGGGDKDSGLSTNTNLSSLLLEAATLAPAFSSATTSYDADVTGGTTSTRVTAFVADSRSRITVNGATATSGIQGDPIDLIIGNTTVTVIVTAQSGATKSYTVVVTRPQPSNDATLSSLAVSTGDLDHIFDPTFLFYTAATSYLGASTRVLAEPTDPLADSLRLDGTEFSVGEPSTWVALMAGSDTTLTIEVTAEDDVTTLPYEITMSRADFATLGQRAYIKATAAGPDQFGFGIALNNDRLLVGAPFEQSSATGVDGDDTNNTLNQAGAAYLYERTGSVWLVTNYLKASNTDARDLFGWTAAITSDDLIIGAPGEQSLDGSQLDNSGNSVGAVYLFDHTGLDPVQTAYLKASNANDSDRFGGSIDAYDDFILVGAEVEASNATGINGDEADNSLQNAGAAYLFEQNSGGDWAQIAYIKASNTKGEQQFGSAVAVDRDSLAIGARRESSNATGVGGDQNDTSKPDAGAVYVFDRSSAVWDQSAYIKASNTDQDDDFGFALDLDGDLLVVGAPGEDSADSGNQDDNSSADSGAVYVFSREATGIWSQMAYLKAPIPGFRDFFGASVALVGNLLAVGAPGERSDATGINGDDLNQNAVDSGAVYLFERDNTGNWLRVAYVKASNTDPGDLFGRNLALAADTLAIAAPEEQSTASGVDGNEADNSGSSAGAVYVFR